MRTDHEFIAEAQQNLGSLLVARGLAGEAEPLLRIALETIRGVDGSGRLRTYRAQSALGEAVATLGRTDEASRLLTQAHTGLRDLLGPNHRYVRLARARLDTLP